MYRKLCNLTTGEIFNFVVISQIRVISVQSSGLKPIYIQKALLVYVIDIQLQMSVCWMRSDNTR